MSESLLRVASEMGENAPDGLEGDVLSRLEAHFGLMSRWGATHNLTTVSSAKDAAERHYLDALAGRVVLDRWLGAHALTGLWQETWLDVGTGAGFPGMVLACRDPQLQIRLLDASRKRCSFLQTCKRELGLQHVTVEHGRAEDAEGAKVVCSRATFSMDKGLGPALSLVQSGGLVALWVGEGPDAHTWSELASREGFVEAARLEYRLPTQGWRAILVGVRR